ncbi:MAG: type II toxin-antitoxin system HigB family toxin [Prevotella sp.]|nr:type II toxin-antitoxin system HigB family toxin [Prevotella sp.]
MKILFPEKIEEFERSHADAKDALARWSSIVTNAEWKNHVELKQDFPSADYVGNNRYVFNIKGNNYRTVVLVVFFAGTVSIRFIGTHSEYDKIKEIKKI